MSVFMMLGGLLCWGFAVLLGVAGGTDIHLGFAGIMMAAGFALFGLADLCHSARKVERAHEEPKPHRPKADAVRRAPSRA